MLVHGHRQFYFLLFVTTTESVDPWSIRLIWYGLIFIILRRKLFSNSPVLSLIYLLTLHVVWNVCNSILVYHNSFLLVTDTPINFIATRAGLHTAITSWTAPASNIPSVEGYEVFYKSEYGTMTSGGNTTAQQTSFVLSSLEPNVRYTAVVVAFGGDLPSNHSNTATIPTSKFLHTLSPIVLYMSMIMKQL